MRKYKVAVIVGVRPDIIRMAKLIKLMAENEEVELSLISTGQHYDAHLCGQFYEQMGIPLPSIQLAARGETACKQHAALLDQLEEPLKILAPDVCVFLGDVNAVIGSIVPLKLDIPIVHIEAGMRSFDLSMPEEKNRIIIDRIANRLYTYHENYSYNLIREGISPSKIVNVGNIIVDILVEYNEQIAAAQPVILERFKVDAGEYALMTLHRNENISDVEMFEMRLGQVTAICEREGLRCIFPLMPRVKSLISENNITLPSLFVTCEPLPFFEFVGLEIGAAIILSDSGTVQEEAAHFGVPCLVLRTCTERPETFESGCVSFISPYTENALDKVLLNSGEIVQLGDGHASERILEDLLDALKTSKLHTSPYIDSFVGSHFS